MKNRILAVIVACLMLCTLFAACSGQNASESSSAASSAPPSSSTVKEQAPPAEIVDGRFSETRKITVEIFDRANDGGSNPADNFYTNFIKEGMLRDHNVEVTYKAVPRWTEVEQLNNLLAAGDAPDICVTYSYPTIQTYANMGGVLDLSTLLEENSDLIPNLKELLGDANLYWNKDPVKGTIWAVEALLFNNRRINTFIRRDWLDTLGLKAPTNIDEFEETLKAFKDNASKLLGADAAKMIPYSTSFDVGYRNEHLILSFVPDSISDKDMYINGFDDRKLLLPNYKEGVRVLNKWYNEGLVWKDFALYGEGDTTEDNLMKAGYVGAFEHNWDYPYRNGDDSIQANLTRNVGPEAAYVAIESFKNDAGVYRKYLSAPIDRKVFFPSTNKEPVASLMYLDWISTLENRRFLQIGEPGATHQIMGDGSIKLLPTTGEKIMNSVNNIDYTITINGLDLGDKNLNVLSLALGYPGTDKSLVEIAAAKAVNEARYGVNMNCGEIKSEEGMATALREKRDALLDQSVVAPADKFDAIFDSGMQDYLNSGGQAIIDERAAAYSKYYG